MTVIDVLAIIGALSWTYPFFVWLNKKLTKTELEIINHKELQIGYTSFGPIINIDMAFSASKDDAFLKEVTISLKHESNQTETFKWEWFEENLMEIHVPETGIVPYKKNQKAVALKVLTNAIAEKKVGFQKPSFQKNYSIEYQKTFEIYQNTLNNNGNLADIKITKEYNDFEHFLKNSFIWKVGKYSGTISCKVANHAKTFNHEFEFFLTNLDVRKLENNIQLCLDSLDNHFVTQSPDFQVLWNWANPIDTKKYNAT